MTAAPAPDASGEARGGQPATVVLRCVCELVGWCPTCRGDAEELRDAGYSEVIKDGPAGVFSFFEAP